jgi:hypothetical protein
MGTRIEIEAAEAPADAPVAVRVRGVPPGQHVTLRAEARRGSEPAWRSEVELLADESATVDACTPSETERMWVPTPA